MRPDLRIEPIRGNVDTRLKKQKSGEYDAILLAAAGLERLGLADEMAEVFPPEQICPAPGQGALAVQTRNHGEALEICRRLNHRPTAQAVQAERAVLAGVGRRMPVAGRRLCSGGGRYARSVRHRSGARPCFGASVPKLPAARMTPKNSAAG